MIKPATDVAKTLGQISNGALRLVTYNRSCQSISSIMSHRISTAKSAAVSNRKSLPSRPSSIIPPAGFQRSCFSGPSITKF